MSKRIDTIVSVAESQFGEPVQKVTAPGGKGRSSYRLFFEDRSLIATWRPNFRRTHLEAYVLQALAPHSDDLPRFIALNGEILFQSDVGSRRLNAEMARRDDAGQSVLAGEAVASIFRLHVASRNTNLAQTMPHLGNSEDWVSGVVERAKVLEHFSSGLPNTFDASALKQALLVPNTQFVKWDCRAGNAALDEADKLRWFDFEYAGVRHGAEDLAWLIGDEAWPQHPADMDAIVRDAYPASFDQSWGAYSQYLALFTTFHAIQRFALIVGEASRRGWIKQQKTLTFDDAGVHPVYAAHICNVGRYYAEKNPLTRPLVPLFEGAGKVFTDMVRAAGRKSA